MAIGNKSVGADIRLQFNTINGPLIIPPDWIGSFTANPDSEWKDWLPITGRRERAVIPMGYAGTLRIIRKGPVLEQFWALFSAAFYAGVSIQAGNILKTIQEPNGTVTQWNYIETYYRFTNAGDWRGNEFVEQELEFYATDCIPVNY